jgi:outer membrane protein assembly factor BamB
MLAALEALESGRPLEAASWLERLAGAPGREEYEPTLQVMRAVAWWRAGERDAAIAILEKARAAGIAAVRVGGREVTLNYPAGGAVAWLEGLAGAPASGAGRRASEWWLHRGDAARNAVVSASRPLLVPRYRVPLTRHPEEARLLERRRKLFADRDMPLLPAGSPLAVDGLLLAHTPMGLLAVDFETGKRVWLQTGGAAGSFFDATPAGAEGDESGDAEARAAIRGVFDDATSGTLSSNGALVFAVESDPASLAGPAVNNLNGMFRALPPAPTGANALSAYRLANRGELAWRLPAADPTPPPVQQPGFPGGAAPPGGWYLGAPLPIGDQLFVLVEERGEIRLDVLAAADGSLLWSQPLAELEEERAIGNRESHLRRVGGLSPSFGDGVLVCPTGAGTTVAVDLATRTLLWAYTYPQPAGGDTVLLQNGVRIRRGNALGGGVVINGQMLGAGSGPSATTGWRDGVPVVTGGRIILTPRESEEIHCVDLRTGSIAWKQPRKEGLYVAGVVNGGVIIVGRRGVQSLGLADGAPRWATPLVLSGACPSGRGVITEGRLFLPLDSPEVIEVNLGDGTVVDRSPSRGGAVAGNLVAYRGEVVSQGVDSLDVFHQTSALQERIDTAVRQGNADPRMLLWKGQMAIDRGAVADGIAAIASAHAAAPESIPDSVVGDALLAALERDFAAAVPLWNARLANGSRSAPERSMLRLIVDGHLRSGDVAAAWATFRRCLDVAPTGAAGQDAGLVTDGADPLVSVSEGRWVEGRLRQFISSASPALRQEIDGFVAERIAAAEAVLPVPERVERLTALADWFAGHPAGKRASEDLVKALGEMITITGATTDAGRDLAVRRDLLLPGLRRAPRPVVEDTEGGAKEKPAAMAQGSDDPIGAIDAAWPFGRVLERRGGAGRGGNDDGGRMTRVMPIPVGAGDASAFPGMHLGYDMQQPGLLATDSFGRRIGEPFGFDVPGRFDGWAGFQAIGAEASTVGRIVVVRSGPLVAGFELTATPGLKHRRLWLLNDTSGAVNEIPMPFLGRGMGGRIGRLGNVPLGLRISEPEEAVPVMAVQGGHARVRGVPVLVNTSLELHDPITGRLLWERHRLPAAGEIIGDEDYVCVVPANGRESAVVSMVDGRMVRVCELPRRDRRLVTCGRRIVVLAEADAAVGPGGVPPGRPEGGLQPATLVLVDPVTMTSVAMGTFAPEARATWAGPEALAVIEPSGTLTVLDLVTGAVRFRTMLPEMPRGMEQVRVSPWEDRLLVFVGRQETAEERKLMEKVGMITNLPQQASSRDVSQPATGTLWAVGRTDGAILWPVPATVLRHCLDPDQPESLPVLLFARQIAPARGGERTRLGILCIDKRTGQALCVDDKIAAQQHMLFGCDMVGDPAAHTVTVGRGAAEGGDVVLEFTGQPTAPRPPFQAASRQPASRDVLAELEYWFEKALLLPLPF